MEQPPENIDDEEILSILDVSKDEPSTPGLKSNSSQVRDNGEGQVKNEDECGQPQKVPQATWLRAYIGVSISVLVILFAVAVICSNREGVPLSHSLMIMGIFLSFVAIMVALGCAGKYAGDKLKHKWKWAPALSYSAFIIFLGILATLIVSGVFESVRSKSAIKPFLPHLSEFVNLGELKHDTDVNNPYIVGKVIIVDMYEGDKDSPGAPPRKVNTVFFSACGMKWTKQFNCHEFFFLPDDLRATTPEEVGTIIWLSWGSRQVGHYGEVEYHKPACRIKCRMTIIDKKRNSIIGEKEFLGGPPPKTTSASFDLQGDYGNKPTPAITSYIESLPRKPMRNTNP